MTNLSGAKIPLEEGVLGRRRIGPFWIEEGLGLVFIGGAILLVVIALYGFAATH